MSERKYRHIPTTRSEYRANATKPPFCKNHVKYLELGRECLSVVMCVSEHNDVSIASLEKNHSCDLY